MSKQSKTKEPKKTKREPVSREQVIAVLVGLGIGLSFGAILVASMHQSDLLCGDTVKERGLMIQNGPNGSTRTMWTSEKVKNNGEPDD